jgi:hypothetical protein
MVGGHGTLFSSRTTRRLTAQRRLWGVWQKRLTKVETGLNHQLRTDKESKLHLMQVHEEDVARLEVKNKETQEVRAHLP